MYDLIIIGAGPAGLTAGIYARRANLKTLILEKETIGGQISSSPLVENYPGFTSISGAELSNNFFEQVMNLGADFEIEEVLSIEDGKIKKVITDTNTYECKSIIIACGAKYRRLGLENEEELIGNGIHFCASCDGAFYKDKIVAVVGGANSAVQNALYLSSLCKKVYLIYRSDKLKAEKTLIEKINKTKNIDVIYNSNITKLIGNPLNQVIINENKELLLDALFISIGLEPNTDIINELLIKDDKNYIISDDCTTNKIGIFVAGDCRQKLIRQVTTATNDGTIAANLAIKYLEDTNFKD